MIPRSTNRPGDLDMLAAGHDGLKRRPTVCLGAVSAFISGLAVAA